MATTPAKKKSRAGQSRLDAIDSPIIVGEIVKKDKEIAKAKMGRPTLYSDTLAYDICERITEGVSLRTICRDDAMPSIATVFSWLNSKPDFLDNYTRAKDNQADTNAEDIQELVHEVRTGKIDPQAARVAGDLLKWSSSKLKPKKYGDKLDLTSDGKALPTPLLGGVTIENNSHMTLSDQQNG